MAEPKEGMGGSRIEALGDGIFAIVMTLLVFDLTVPEGPDIASGLVRMGPKFFGYLVSFALLGVYWRGHWLQFKYIKKSDHVSQWINLIFLLLVALIPFSTKLLSAHPTDIVAVSVYATNLILIGLALYWHWEYATSGGRLTEANLSETVIRYGKFRCLLAPVGYFTALCAAFISPAASWLIFAIVPVLYIFPGMHSLWLKKLAEK
jgi:uncharacterized membrane protein